MYKDTYLERECGGSLKKLAIRWGPIDYQYVPLKNDDYKTKRDLLCPVDFGCYPGSSTMPKASSPKLASTCWDTRIVRQRLAQAAFQDLIPTAYYSAAVTDSHYFILYAYYHADDSTHPNDLEGCLLILEKNDSRPLLLGMVTVAHYDFVPFVYKNSMKVKSHPLWQRDFEMEVEEEEEGEHVLIQQEEGKHGLYALGHRKIGPLERVKRRVLEIIGRSEDVIVYYPGEAANLYTKERLYRGKGTPHNPTFYYELIDVLDDRHGLWNKYLDAQKSVGNQTFTKEGAFHSEGSLGHANGPWLWEPGGQLVETISQGAMWNDPAKLAKHMFEPQGEQFGTNYQKRMMDKG